MFVEFPKGIFAKKLVWNLEDSNGRFYTCILSAGLPPEMRVRPHMPHGHCHRFSELATKSWTGSLHPLWRHLWMYFVEHAWVGGKGKTVSVRRCNHGLDFGSSEVLMSLRCYLQAQSQGHDTINSVGERAKDRINTQSMLATTVTDQFNEFTTKKQIVEWEARIGVTCPKVWQQCIKALGFQTIVLDMWESREMAEQ